MKISIKTGAIALLAILTISSIALHSRAACNPPGVAEVDVILESVTFSNDNVVYTDADTAYSGTDWETNKRQPVSYKSGEPLTVQATWTLGRAGLDETDWRVRGVLTAGNMSFSTIGGSTTTVEENNGVLTLAATEADTAFAANIVQYHAHFKIEWEFSFDEGDTWKDCSEGVSDNLMYITHGDPQAKMFHTPLHIGCFKADGESSPGSIVTEIWGEFSDRSVKKVDPATGAFTGNKLTYWGTRTPEPPVTTAGLLLSGDGKCGAWSRFFRDTIKVQGISADSSKIAPHTIFMKPAVGFTVKSSLDGQGDMSPPAAVKFVNHAVVDYGGKIYDPSYGAMYEASGTTSALAAWENAALVSIAYVSFTPPPPNTVVPHAVGDTEETTISISN